ncbi:hypothetical protein RR48_01237 [Papilio machaon]|uniref:Uncharacterized protein n=1 Tax=Papilio machaon TaxID=76193 RepID=A0A0N0PFG9_PAPMA|nr:hypothetical protein RR48_01237 [Papilio machaon]
MPRKSHVTVEEAVQSLKNFILYFPTSELPNYSASVWKEISKDLNNKWTHHNVYNNVVQDRRNILNLARQEKGIHIPLLVDEANTKSDNTINNSSVNVSSSESTTSESECAIELYVNERNAPEDVKSMHKGAVKE